MTAAARRAFWASFELGHECSLCEKITIDQELPVGERQRQAAALRAAHYGRVARNARRASGSGRAAG